MFHCETCHIQESPRWYLLSALHSCTLTSREGTRYTKQRTLLVSAAHIMVFSFVHFQWAPAVPSGKTLAHFSGVCPLELNPTARSLTQPPMRYPSTNHQDGRRCWFLICGQTAYSISILSPDYRNIILNIGRLTSFPLRENLLCTMTYIIIHT